MSHANAALTPRARLRLARLIVEDGWKPSAAAKMFMVSTVTARKWAARYRAEGPAGMVDRSSRPRTCPNRTSPQMTRQILRLRWRRRLGPVQIGGLLGVAPSTVHAVLVRGRVNRLSHIDRVTGEPLRRYEHPHPGSLIHVDVTKFGNIPDGGGCRYVGRPGQGQRPSDRTRTGERGKHYRPLIGTAFLHTVIDDHSRVAYVEICADEKAADRDRGPGTGGRVVRRTRRHRRAGALRQRQLLPVPRLARRLHRTRHHAQAHPALPAPDQRQMRAVPPHPGRRLGLRPLLRLRRPNAEPPCPAGSTSTITTGSTPRSAARPSAGSTTCLDIAGSSIHPDWS